MTDTYRLMCLLAELSGQPATRKDGGILKRLAGRSGPQAVEDALYGLAAVRRGDLQLPEGALAWLDRPFGAALLCFRDHTSGRLVLDLVGDAWRRSQHTTVHVLSQGIL